MARNNGNTAQGQPVKRLLCHYPNSNDTVSFPISSPRPNSKSTNYYEIEGFENPYRVRRSSFYVDKPNHGHFLEVVDFVTNLKMWANPNKIWDTQVWDRDANVNELSNEAQKVIRAMIRVLYYLRTKQRHHGALHNLENWAMRIMGTEEIEVELVLLNQNMSGRADDDDKGFYKAVCTILGLHENNNVSDNLGNNLKDLLQLLTTLPKDLQFVLYHPSLRQWKSRRVYIINAMFFCKSLNSDALTKLVEQKLNKMKSAYGWRDKVVELNKMKSAYGRRDKVVHQRFEKVLNYEGGYKGGGYELLRFHRNIFCHINEKEEEYLNMKFVEYKLSSIFENFLTDLYKIFGKKFSVEDI